MVPRVFLSLLAAVGLALLPLAAQAQESKRPQGPDREGMFKRLDKNQDGVIAGDEIPDAAPEPLKQWLKKADKNADKRITADELKEAVKAGPPGMPFGPPGAMSRRGAMAGGSMGRGPRGGGPMGPAPAAGAPVTRGPRPPQATKERGDRPTRPDAQRPGVPDPKALFAMLDKNKDKSLSLDEFSAGWKDLQRRIGERIRNAFPARTRPPFPPSRFGPMAHRGGPRHFAGAWQPGKGGVSPWAGQPGKGWGGPWGRPFGQAWGAPWAHQPGPRPYFGPWSRPGSWSHAGPWSRPSLQARPGLPPRPFAPPLPGGSWEARAEHLRAMVAAMVREELRELKKPDPAKSRSKERESKPEPRR